MRHVPAHLRMIIALLLASCVSALADDESEKAEARIEIDDSVHDWGRLFHGQVARHEFRITNRGTATILLGDVKTNCGCTFASPIKKGTRLPPGQTYTITLRVESDKLPFDQLKRGEAVRKSGTILTAGGQQIGVLWMQGFVQEVLEFEPTSPKLEIILDGPQTRLAPIEITARSKLSEPLLIESVLAASGHVGAKFSEIEAGKRFKISIWPTIDLKTTRSRHPDRVIFKTRFGKTNVSIPLAITVVVRKRIQCEPSPSFFFSRKVTRAFLAGGPAPTKTLNLKSIASSGHRFKILSTSLTKNVVRAKLKTIEDGRHYRLEIQLLEPKAAKRLLKEEIILKTDDPLVPEIKIKGTALF